MTIEEKQGLEYTLYELKDLNLAREIIQGLELTYDDFNFDINKLMSLDDNYRQSHKHAPYYVICDIDDFLTNITVYAGYSDCTDQREFHSNPQFTHFEVGFDTKGSNFKSGWILLNTVISDNLYPNLNLINNRPIKFNKFITMDNREIFNLLFT